MFVTLSTITKLWIQPRCLPRDKWIKKKNIYILYGVLVKHKEQIYVIFGKNKLETIVSEINQNQRKERHFSLCVDSRLHTPTHNMCLSIYNMYVIYMKPLCM